MPSIIAGLLAFAVGLWGLSVWWYSVEELLRGLIPLLLLLFGVVALMAGVSRVATVADDEKSDEDLVDLDDSPAEEPAAKKVAVKKKRAAVKKKSTAGKRESKADSASAKDGEA